LPVLRELECGAHDRASFALELHFAGNLVEVFFTVAFVEHRLGIEQIHLARPGIHEWLDDALRFRRKVRRAGPAGGLTFAREQTLGRSYFAGQQRRHCRSVHAAGHTVHKAAPADLAAAGRAAIVTRLVRHVISHIS
jgi:hypothetical protein